MHAAEKPPYAESNEDAGIGLGFNRATQRLLEAACRLMRGVYRLTVKILSGARGLIVDCAFGLRSCVAAW